MVQFLKIQSMAIKSILKMNTSWTELFDWLQKANRFSIADASERLCDFSLMVVRSQFTR